jgi:hypothetical protein
LIRSLPLAVLTLLIASHPPLARHPDPTLS